MKTNTFTITTDDIDTRRDDEKDLEHLWKLFYQYIYKYEIGHPKDFNGDCSPHWKTVFLTDIVKDEAMRIKVTEGY